MAKSPCFSAHGAIYGHLFAPRRRAAPLAPLPSKATMARIWLPCRTCGAVEIMVATINNIHNNS